jgi:XTP/dITP diphosphohydrolase
VLEGKPPAQRTARYQCALVFMRSSRDPSPLICQASWEGRIITERRGSGGFGYDPIFEVAERGLTAAELSAAEKNLLSHRGKALRGLVAQLREIYSATS